MTRRRKTLILLFALVIAALILLALAGWRGARPALSKRSTPAVNPSAETPLPAATGTLPPNPQNPVPTFAEDDPSDAPYTCIYTPVVDALRADLSAEQWLHWIELLSGAKPVELNGENYTIQTRYTESLFNGDPDARAFEFVHDQLLLWGYLSQETLFVEDYLPFDYETETPWKNLIAVIPGTDPQLAQQEILLTAHLDSITAAAPEGNAPGADDNATGVATLLEAARILKDQAFKRTIKIIFFSGEERGLHGSRAYTAAHPDEMENVVGVINLDMFGYDADNDRCFELHVGTLPASDQLGACLTDTLQAANLNLTYDYLTENAIGASDHSSFWNVDVGAVLVLENFMTQDASSGCGEIDRNPNYHTEGDLASEINLRTAFDIAQAVILTTAAIAEPEGY